MTTETYKVRVIVTACLLALASLGNLAMAQSSTSDTSSGSSNTGTSSRGTDTQSSGATTGSTSSSKDEASAMKHVDDAVAVVRKLENEPGMNKLMQQAKGVFIVPTYGRAALGVGAAGGPGVLLARRDDGTWSDPAFYNIGGISIGAQAGAEGGPIALILNNDKAVNSFLQKNNFSLTADAGLTVVNWAKVAQGNAGAGDITAWSGTKGLFGNVASIGVNDVRFNQGETNAYYHQPVAARDVVSGKAKNPQADMLKQALAATVSGTASGSSGTGTSGSGTDSSGTTGTGNK